MSNRDASPSRERDGEGARSRSCSPKKDKPDNWREGDWLCTECGGHNYSGKNKCFKCHVARAPAPGERAGLPESFRDGDWMCECGGHNYKGKVLCFKCKTHRCLVGTDSTGRTVEKFRKGDWICSCDAHNYAGKFVCFKCSRPIPTSNALPFNAPTEGNNAFRHGDWLCKCGGHNYTGKQQCYKCHAPKHQGGVTQAAGGPRGGKVWLDDGTGGGQLGFADLAHYAAASVAGLYDPRYAASGYDSFAFAAQAAQAAVAAAGAFRGGGGGPSASVKGGAGRPANWKDGDWICQCGGHNYRGKTVCYKCKENKANSEVPVLPGDFRAGDWMCAACNGHNYTGKDMCYKCQAPRS